MNAQKEHVWAYECPCCYETYEPGQQPEDLRCNRCDAAPNLREKQSEFGAGVVVCLAKFSEHLWTDREHCIYELLRVKEGKASADSLSRSARINLEIAQESGRRAPGQAPIDLALEDAVHMWASGAGDHFFDLDEERAPQPLKDLAELVIRMRNTHLGSNWTWQKGQDMDRVRELWRESCVALDRALGTVPNWGEY